MRSTLLFALVICMLLVVNGGVVKRSDDVNADIQTLQTLVQQQAAAISSLQAGMNSQQAAFNSQQATVSALQASFNSQQATINSQQATINSQQAKITGLENKVQTLSKPVAFTAMFSHDDWTNGVSLGTHQTLVFDNAITNAGNGYNPSTGIFTAPLGGFYDFNIVAIEPNGASHPNLALGMIKNGGLVDEMWVTNNLNDIDEQGSTQSVIHLAAGDQVWIRQEGFGDAVRGSVWTVFTGFLVHAD